MPNKQLQLRASCLSDLQESTTISCAGVCICRKISPLPACSAHLANHLHTQHTVMMCIYLQSLPC